MAENSKARLKVLQPTDANPDYINPCTKAEAVFYENENFSNLTDTKKVLDYLLEKVSNIGTLPPSEYTNNINECINGNTFYLIRAKSAGVPNTSLNSDWSVWTIPSKENYYVQFASPVESENGSVYKRIQKNGVWQSWNKVMTVNDCYPVGSLYLAYSKDLDPNNLFGGVWVRYSDSRVLRVRGSNDPGQSGGNDSFKISVKQLPPHKHLFSDHSQTMSWAGEFDDNGNSQNFSTGAYLPTAGMDTGPVSSTAVNQLGTWEAINNTTRNKGLANMATSEKLFDTNTPVMKNRKDPVPTVATTSEQVAVNNLPSWTGIYVWRRTG